MATAPAKIKPKTSRRKKAVKVETTGTAPLDPKIRFTLTAICNTAQDLEEADDQDAVRQAIEAGGTSPEQWHQLCPIGTFHAGILTLCNHDWHDHNPKCWLCKTKGTDLDPQRRQCLDGAACADRIHVRIVDDPRFERYRQYHMAAAEVEGAKPRIERQPSESRPTSGQCEHCGEPTKGGKFVAGHDAKLKGDLIRAGAQGDIDAVAEAMFRNWYKPGRYPDLEDAAHAIVQAHETVAWLAQRVAQRLGEDV